MADQDYVASGAFRADGVNYTRGQEVPVDSISNNHLLKETGAVVLANSDEGQAAIADYERAQEADAQAQEEREAQEDFDRDAPVQPEVPDSPLEEPGTTEYEEERLQPVDTTPPDEPFEEAGATDDRGDDPRAYPPADQQEGVEMVDPGGSVPPENLETARSKQHAEMGASPEELAEKDAQKEANRQQALEAQEQAAAQEGNELADNEQAAGSQEDVEATEGAKELAEKEGVDLSQVEGTGQGGKVTKPDVEKHLNQ